MFKLRYNGGGFVLQMCFFAAVFLLLFINVPAQEKAEDSGFGEQVVIPEKKVGGRTVTCEVNGNKLQGNIYGQGSPAIVMITGFGAPQTYWSSVLDEISQVTTVFTYDRPGYGMSAYIDDGKPIDGQKAAGDLKLLLEKAEVKPPYVIIGHSMGCNIARLFCSAYPELVSGLILEDPGHEDLKEAQRAIMKEGELEKFDKIASGTPPGLNAVMSREYQAIDITNEQLRNSAALPEMPLVVITSGQRRAPPMFSEETQRKWIEIGLEYVKKLAELVPGGQYVKLDKAGHNIHIDEPETFVQIVEEVVKDAQRLEL